MKGSVIFILLISFLSIKCQEGIDNEKQVLKEKLIFGHFQNFLKGFNRTYNSYEEMKFRLQIFRDNFLRQEADMTLKKSKHSVGITQFFDLMPQEFTTSYLNLNITIQDLMDSQKLEGSLLEDMKNGMIRNKGETDRVKKVNNSDIPEKKNSSNVRMLQSLPDSFDWRSQGVIKFIKNQGSCGSCWSFSATANIEARYYLKYGIYENFSEQQLINCDSNSNGCNGGKAGNAFYYLRYNSNGFVRESQLPYVGYQNICSISNLSPVAQVTAWAFSGTLDEDQIALMLLNYGPLSAAINAKYLQYYTGGIIDENELNCNPYSLNHAINLVGYGIENGQKYWIVQNSWGQYWGESGYFRISRGKSTCGINQVALTSFVK
jgi:cathepsin F